MNTKEIKQKQIDFLHAEKEVLNSDYYDFKNNHIFIYFFQKGINKERKNQKNNWNSRFYYFAFGWFSALIIYAILCLLGY